MGRLRRIAAIWTARLVGFACRVSGKQGVTLAGQIALKIDPEILKELSAQVREKIFVTCGTNGKTTTNNLLCQAIEAEGKKVVCNHTGSNMLNGVVSAFVLQAGLLGNLDADYACIEVDEASTVRIFPHFKPDYMVLTNLFRDQLDRYGEIDITMNLLKKAMDGDVLSFRLALSDRRPVQAGQPAPGSLQRISPCRFLRPCRLPASVFWQCIWPAFSRPSRAGRSACPARCPARRRARPC